METSEPGAGVCPLQHCGPNTSCFGGKQLNALVSQGFSASLQISWLQNIYKDVECDRQIMQKRIQAALLE